jgi:predicted enzyme related to lactoylglutathione lyase
MRYPPGTPCWVDTLQREPLAALDFYGPLFGWEFSEPGPGGYVVARLDGRDVAGIGELPSEGPAIWSTYVRVEDAGAELPGATLLLGPLDAAPAGRLAVFADPTGAAFCVWEPGEREGAQLVNEPNTWLMSSLHTPDPVAASAFYGATFGWQAETMGPVTLFRLPGYVGGQPDEQKAAQWRGMPRDIVAVMAPPDPQVPPHWNVNFRIEDADAIAAHAAALGGTVLMAPMDTPGFRSAVLRDPQGAVFSISQPVGSS